MPDRYTVSSEGPEPLGGELVDSGSGKNMLEEEDRLKGGGNIQAYNKDSSVSYNTISCPCSSYPINLDGISTFWSGDDVGIEGEIVRGKLGCERNDRGTKKRVTPITINNHLINNKPPKVGDKWECAGIRCKEGNFEWDTLHVIDVIKKGQVGESSSLFNSKKSILNCYIPTTNNLKDYNSISYRLSSSDPTVPPFPEPIAIIDGESLYEQEVHAIAYNIWKNKPHEQNSAFTEIVKYEKDGLSGYLRVDKLKNEKLITNIEVNNVNVLDNVNENFDTIYKEATSSNKLLFNKNGDKLKVKISGINNPTFTISLKDSSGCEILQDKHKNVTVKGMYRINQEIPALASGVTSEIYDLKISPSADTRYYYNLESPVTGIINMKIYQYKNPTYTLTASASTASGVTTTASDISFTGAVGTDVSEDSGFTAVTHTTTLTSAVPMYCVDPMPKFYDLITKNKVIKKTVIREDRTDTSGTSRIIVGSRAYHDASNNVIYQGDLKEGMTFTSTITKTKAVRKSVDLDIHKEPCDNCPERDILTNKFEIENTNDIFEGMVVSGVDYVGREFRTNLESIDCGKSITLEDHFIIDKNTNLTFIYIDNGFVGEVRDCDKGQEIILDGRTKLPHGSEITFENGNNSDIGGHIRCSTSGSTSITVTTTIDRVKYGQEDVTFTLNTDDLISYKSSARDQYITVGKDSQNFYLDFVRNDKDEDKYSKTITITKQPSSGALVTGTRANYTPNTGFTGKDTIKFTSVGTASDPAAVASEERTIFITVK
jgi:hypothetical protein|tara:strand:+ start:499 stop:2811 length:2313 start_codon:yes stop_codon:yes gene_type:complete